MSHATLAAELLRPQARHLARPNAWFVRAKRDKAAQTLPEWELLRETAAGIKAYTMGAWRNCWSSSRPMPRVWARPSTGLATLRA